MTEPAMVSCAGTDFECDCDCDCVCCPENRDVVAWVGGCEWPNCECSCEPSCKGCALMADEAAARR